MLATWSYISSDGEVLLKSSFDLLFGLFVVGGASSQPVME